MNASIASIQIGCIREYTDENGKRWTSAIEKKQVAGSVRVTSTQVEGDEQADLKHHGGTDKAILGYSANHFACWRDEVQVFADLDRLNGAFGENLTIVGLDEEVVCIGDIYAIGTAELQVSQPRQPCWKLSRRWKLPKLAVRVQETGRTGWYFRVLSEGEFAADNQIQLLERPHAEWSVARAHAVMHAKPRASDEDLRLANCSALATSWRTQLRDRAIRSQEKSAARRLYGDQAQ